MNSENNTKTVRLPIKGMHCDSCARLIEDALSEVDGVRSAKVDYGTKLAVIESGDSVSEKDLMDAVASVGYSVESVDGTEPAKKKKFLGLF